MTVGELLAAVERAGYRVAAGDDGPKLQPLDSSAPAALDSQLLSDLKLHRNAVWRAAVVREMVARAVERNRPLFWMTPDPGPYPRMDRVKGGAVPDEALYLTVEGDTKWQRVPRPV